MKEFFAEKVLRAFPLLVYIKLTLAFILFKEEGAVFLAGFLLLSDSFNWLLKHALLKPIMGKTDYPIFGTGTRPKGAINCGAFATGKKSTSYGMPSGHSQFMGVLTTYILLNLMNATNTKFPKHDVLRGMFVIGAFIMGASVCLSRIYLGCHTPQQVLIGTIIGIILGTWYYYNEDNVIKLFKKKVWDF